MELAKDKPDEWKRLHREWRREVTESSEPAVRLPADVAMPAPTTDDDDLLYIANPNSVPCLEPIELD